MITFEKKEILLQLKWTTLSVIVCGLVGSVIAGFQVVLFEQTNSGRYAIETICIKNDLSCEKQCSQADIDPWESGINCDCCLETKDVPIPLGTRIKKLALQYAIIGSSLGIVVGLSIAEERKRKA